MTIAAFWSESALSGKAPNAARGLGECCKLPQWVWVEPGRQMTFGAFLVGKRFIWKGPR